MDYGYEHAGLASRHQVRATHISSIQTGFFRAACMYQFDFSMWTSHNEFRWCQGDHTWPTGFPDRFSIELVGGFLQEPEEVLSILWRSAIRVVQMLPTQQTDM